MNEQLQGSDSLLPDNEPDGRFAPLYDLLPDWAGIEDALWRNLHAHGLYGRWQTALHRLPSATVARPALGDLVRAQGALAAADLDLLRDCLATLHPWRKGPFDLFGIHIDAEWRSDLKWRRVAPAVALAGGAVLDVGCGNGYFGWRMLEAGAALVVGVDGNPLCHMQHQAINHYLGSRRNWVLPLRFEQLPAQLAEGRFDAAFSMGVLYHTRRPKTHLAALRRCLKPAGRLLVESLVVEAAAPLHPVGRYANMGNVHVIPTPDALVQWMQEAGLCAAEIVDLSVTTTKEQRSTPWMRHHSLADALDAKDANRTKEGHPAPKRCVVAAQAPC